MEPVNPAAAAPDDNDAAPLSPEAPAVAVVSETLPLDVAELCPLRTIMLPPVAAALSPPESVITPPSSAPPEAPADIDTAPVSADADFPLPI